VPLKVILTKTPSKYLESLDRPTKDRIIEKLEEIAADPSILDFPNPWKEQTSELRELENIEYCLR
jgi:hypothetical protein